MALLMGSSALGFSGSQIMMSRKCYRNLVEVHSFKEKRTQSLDFKLSNSRLQSRTAFMCKCESIQLEERTSPNEGRCLFHVYEADMAAHLIAREEIQKCYEVIERLGRGVVYLGSSRMGKDHPHYIQTLELSREISMLLDCTTWTGAGPGLMDAATKGALQAGKPVGGFKIGKEAGEWTATNYHSYLPSHTYLTCRFFSARKHGLVDAVVRSNASDRTAVIALPGGIGTLDEMFEILALIQLQRIGSELPVPFLVMNYDSFYSKLLDFLDECEHWGVVSKGEVASLWKVCNGNSDALEYLAKFYNLDPGIKKNEAELGRLNGTVP